MWYGKGEQRAMINNAKGGRLHPNIPIDFESCRVGRVWAYRDRDRSALSSQNAVFDVTPKKCHIVGDRDPYSVSISTRKSAASSYLKKAWGSTTGANHQPT